MTQCKWAKLFDLKLFSFIFGAAGEINLNYEPVARFQLCRPQQSQYGFDRKFLNITTRHLINGVRGKTNWDSLIAHQPVRFVDDKHAEFYRRDEPERSDLFLNRRFIALRHREIDFFEKNIVKGFGDLGCLGSGMKSK